MNLDKEEGLHLVKNIAHHGHILHCDIIICPPFTHLDSVASEIKHTQISLGAQTVSEFSDGAFTGEISCKMLQSFFVKYVILGHSERRSIYKETNAQINAKVHQALTHHINPILCVGETLEEREGNKTFDIIRSQLKEGLANVTVDSILTQDLIIAYEPVWAIGTGKTATPEQAQEVHAMIRKELKELFNSTISEKTRLQYGGSVKPENSKTLLEQPDIDGALVGGACLKADSFLGIIHATH